MTPFFVDRGAHPRLLLSAWHVDHTAHESPGKYAQRMSLIEETMWEPLATTQAASKAKLDAGKVDRWATVCYPIVQRWGCPIGSASQGAACQCSTLPKLRPRWNGPFTVTACPNPNAYTLVFPRKLRCSPSVNTDLPAAAQALFRAHGRAAPSRPSHGL